MKDVRDLYRNLIVEHYKKPRNFREILNADRRAHGQNVLCGDAFTVFLKIDCGYRLYRKRLRHRDSISFHDDGNS